MNEITDRAMEFFASFGELVFGIFFAAWWHEFNSHVIATQSTNESKLLYLVVTAFWITSTILAIIGWMGEVAKLHQLDPSVSLSRVRFVFHGINYWIFLSLFLLVAFYSVFFSLLFGLPWDLGAEGSLICLSWLIASYFTSFRVAAASASQVLLHGPENEKKKWE